MKYPLPLLECETILRKHRIEATPIRIEILRAVHHLSPNPFTINQVIETLMEQGVPQKRNTIEYTLRMFKARKIIDHTGSNATARRGRVEIKMAFMIGTARIQSAG